jgi:serine/threonine protein kinase
MLKRCMSSAACLSAVCAQPHVITLLSDVAAGMNYLHLRNCVHGDLKPANVLLKKQQGAPFGHVAKVSDFGLSK